MEVRWRGCTAGTPLEERADAAAAAAVAAAAGTQDDGRSHPAAGNRAQQVCLAAPTAVAPEDWSVGTGREKQNHTLLSNFITTLHKVRTLRSRHGHQPS